MNFLKHVNFNDSTFSGNVYFSGSTFSSNVYFFGSTFSGNVYFSNSKFLGIAYFWNLTFSGEAYFGASTFSKTHRTVFEKIKFDGFDKKTGEIIPAKIRNIVFSEVTLFRKIDLSRVSFLDSNIEKVRFDECEWGKTKPIFEKKEIKWKKTKSRNILWDEIEFLEKKIGDPKKIETLNRQFKKNFDDKKNYQIADDFHVGEMEMKLLIVKKEKKYGTYIFLWFYKYISKYNSNPFYALWWLFGIIIVFAFVYFIDLEYKTIFDRLSKAFQLSFTNTIIVLKSPEKIEKKLVYGISFLYFQIIFSTAVWTLFILSLRRKFKR